MKVTQKQYKFPNLLSALERAQQAEERRRAIIEAPINRKVRTNLRGMYRG